MIGGNPEYKVAAGKNFTYFDADPKVYTEDPQAVEKSNFKFMEEQMDAHKPFYITLDKPVPGEGLTNEMKMLNSNPLYSGSFSERYFGPTWYDAIENAGSLN